MKSLSNIIAIFLSVALLQGCAGGAGLNNQTGGNVIGGLAGGLLGAQFGKGKGQIAAAAGGALLGALAGGMVGAQMDERDRQMAELAQRNALETSRDNQPMAWRNPNTGHSGSITPCRTYQQGGRYCREYRHKINVGGKVQEAHGIACRCPDGSWEIIK